MSAEMNAYDDIPNSHCGIPSSAFALPTASISPSVEIRCRFHQPLRSEAKYRTPSGDHLGWKIDSATPPATQRVDVSVPSGPNSPTHSSQPSHGMFGWFQVNQASWVPSGLTRGDE